MNQYGRQIKATVLEKLGWGVTDAQVTVVGWRGLDCTLKGCG